MVKIDMNKKIETWEEALQLMDLLKKFNKGHENDKIKFYFGDRTGFYFEELHAICIYARIGNEDRECFIDNSNITLAKIMKIIETWYEKLKEN